MAQEVEGDGSATYGQCFQSFPNEVRALNLGQRWGDPSPTATMHIDLHTVTRASSSFDFRTFDQEGVIFFGDTQPEVDWFILAMRGGKPEIQIFNNVTKITVSGGPRIDDGKWHQLMVKNEGHAIALEVDGEMHLAMSHVSHSIVSRPSPSLRIGVGGLLMPPRRLLAPLNPAMDGCMRRWNWLNKSLEWQEASSLEDKGTKRCFRAVSRGSFFPGDGLATFSLADLSTGRRPADGSWDLRVSVQVRAPQQAATLLAVAPAGQRPLLRLDQQGQDLVLRMGNETELRVPLPARGCLESHLFVRATSSQLTLTVDNTEDSALVPKPEFESLRRAWLAGRGSLVIGGLPGQDVSMPAKDHAFFRGCLRAILVHGRELDLDAVQSRSNSIWAHSCPGEDAGGDGGH
ncbi:sex hormone-binding globulin [Varanus komodoensis]|uniref:sex hormone-binding globulin n=1 Tax=Varanus komodoensis TaxID=61221 RepID=UPI001CF773BB|nr:sex hormone-binding globulin [Varanus komodoensis]